MMYRTKFLIYAFIVFLLIGCLDSKKQLDSDSVDYGKRRIRATKYYKCLVSGIPVAPGKRLGGLYKVVYHVDDQSTYDQMKARYLEVLFWIAIAGIVGVVGAAILFYYGKSQWVDVGAMSGILSVVGIVGSLYFDYIVWILVFVAVIAFSYFLMVLYRKHRDEKCKESLVQSFQVAKNLPWEKGKEEVEKLRIPEWIKTQVDKKKKLLRKRNLL